MAAVAADSWIDVAVIGAGPAGLAAGCAAAEAGADVAVLEAGRPVGLRDRTSPADLLQGVGGAGLYSDGKFSFAPSGTAIWVLEPRELLREAYAWTATVLPAFGVPCPPFPEAAMPKHAGPVKGYPSQYMAPERRAGLVDFLAGSLSSQLRPGALARIFPCARGVRLELADGTSIHARAAILATGRFGPLLDARTPMAFRRVELGIRLETPVDSFPLDSRRDLVDPKWIRNDGNGVLQWRTFCCCRGGEVFTTEIAGIRTVSGRSDGPRTDRSNVGLNVRLLDPRRGERALAHALESARAEPPSTVGARELLEDPEQGEVARRLGADASSALAAGLRLLEGDFAPASADARLHVPAIEGVAYYPRVDASLRVASRLWAAGDATGIFRGLVPALVSGRFAGAQAALRG